MTGLPVMTPVAMGPMTGYPVISGVRWFFPATACVYINAVADYPIFPDPYVTGAGCFGPDDYRSYRPHMHIDLRGGRQGAGHNNGG